jgi:hypothetical protein
MTPTFTDFYAATAVTLIAFVFFIFTAGNHSTPNVIFWPPTPSSSRAVGKTWTTSLFKFSKEASATTSLRTDKVTGAYDRTISAFADAVPSNVSDFDGRRLSLYGESAEYLAGQIAERNFFNDIEVPMPHQSNVMHRAELAFDSFSGTIRGSALHGNNDITRNGVSGA